MKILLLGGIAESKELARSLLNRHHETIYSIAGLVRQPELDCEIHSGGFSSENSSGVEGLARFCDERQIELLIDATHPYAEEISANAASASEQSGIDCWRFNRPGWDPDKYPEWHRYQQPRDLFPSLETYQRPFFTVGKSILNHASSRQLYQTWLVRSAVPFEDIAGIEQINAIGPFSYDDELALMRNYRVDALICKNSGCNRVSAKLDAARTLSIPVFVQARPQLAPVARSFDSLECLLDAIETVSQTK